MLTLKELQRELEDLKKNKTNLVEHRVSGKILVKSKIK
jgi:transcriptional regulator of NAD metabolism